MKINIPKSKNLNLMKTWYKAQDSKLLKKKHFSKILLMKN